MTLIEVLSMNQETVLIRVDQIESIGLPARDRRNEELFHGWIRLLSGRVHGFGDEMEAERVCQVLLDETELMATGLGGGLGAREFVNRVYRRPSPSKPRVESRIVRS